MHVGSDKWGKIAGFSIRVVDAEPARRMAYLAA
jgi:hypothetical protein